MSLCHNYVSTDATFGGSTATTYSSLSLTICCSGYCCYCCYCCAVANAVLMLLLLVLVALLMIT